jgi:hypothetical protein
VVASSPRGQASVAKSRGFGIDLNFRSYRSNSL